MNCQNITFSTKQSQKRIEKAKCALPSIILKKILFFALYLLGAKFKAIALIVGIPEESGKTTINRVMKDGIFALSDRRQSTTKDILHTALPITQQIVYPTVSLEDECCIIIFGDVTHQVKIPLKNRVYLKSILLSLLQANMLSVNTVSSVLGITVAHCRELANRLINDDVTDVLVDKRKGQKKDFCVDQSVKAELIMHFSARTVTGHSTSSETLTELINTTMNTNISPRTIRWHLNKLGLIKIRRTLPELVESLKKSPDFAK